MSAPQPAAPSNFSELIAGAARLYKLNARSLIGLFVVLVAAGSALRYLGILIAISLNGSESMEFAFGIILPFIATIMVGSIGLGLSAHRVFDPPDPNVPEDQRFPWKDAIASALLAAIIAIVLVQMTLGIALMFLALTFGPLIVIHCVVLEDMNLRDALTRARLLLAGNTLRVLGYMFGIAVGIGLIQATAAQIIGVSTSSVPNLARGAIFEVSIVLILGLLLPFYSAAAYLAYADLRARESRRTD